MQPLSRRNFIKKAALTASVAPFLNFPLNLFAVNANVKPLSVHIFSKHLQFLDYKTTGQVAAELGFAGVDLTVRKNGHVLPEHVKTQLPLAIREIKAGGSVCEMIATNVQNINNVIDVDVLKTAAELGVKYYRPNWFKYPEGKSLIEALSIYQKQVKDLSLLNKELGIIGCYQNIDGTKVGSSFWEVEEIMKTADADYFGSQFDVRHAVVEGGFSWENAFKLLQPRIKTIVLKDFKWGKVNGNWEAINTPIGEGMVDFDNYFKMLKALNLNPPVSLHVEYDMGGAEKGNKDISIDKKVVFETLKKDLDTIQILWEKA